MQPTTPKLIDILRAEKIAQDRMHSDGPNWNRHFILILEGGMPVSCTWLDPYFGLFRIYGKENEGFISISQLPDTARAIVMETDS